MELQGVVRTTDPGFTSGDDSTISLGRRGEVATADYSARYMASVLRGKCFSFVDTSGRAIALSSATAVVGPAIFNPPSSGVNMVVLYVGVDIQVAGTGAGTLGVVTRQSTGAAAVTGTAATARNRLTSGAAGICQALTTPTLDAAGVVMDTLGTNTTAAITTTQIPTFGKWLDGSLIVGPNGALTIGTLTTALAAASGFTTFIWEEVPI